jgi:hypothetical protein
MVYFTLQLTSNEIDVKIFINNLKPITNYELVKVADELKISNFRGVFTKDTLPSKINKIECGILNLDISKNNGTHWVCYYKTNEKCYYFDSFGSAIRIT